MSLRPDLTVAAVIERDGQFLLVEERVGNAMVFNQPAGHVERSEELVAAVIRETLEETAWTFKPDALTGIYLWDQPEKQKSFLRFTFCGQVTDHDASRRLEGENALARETLLEALPLHEGHHIVGEPVRFSRIDEREDVGVLERRDDVDLAQEALRGERRGELRQQNLDRNASAVLEVSSEEDHGHSAALDLVLETVN